jgi:hypothetical protein
LHTGEPSAQDSSARSPRGGGTPNVQIVGESVLYGVFKKGGRLTNEHALKLESMFFSALKQYDRWEYENSLCGDIAAIDVAVEMYTQLALTYNELLVGVIPPEAHTHYFASPEGFCKDQEASIPDYVRRKLSLLTLSHSNSWNLSKAITKLIRLAAAADIENGRIF